jgi:hypothetical protein
VTRTALALSLALLVPQAAAARPADCLLIIDAVEYINGRCDFQAIDDDGSFQIMGLNGQFFAQVLIYRKGRGEGWWNGAPYVSRAHSPLGDLRREDACWVNPRVSVCAW